MTYTGDYSQSIEKLNNEIGLADAIVIGAGSGLSTTAGLTYSGVRFEDHFSDFIAQYHYGDMYSAGFYPYSSLEEYWAYWSRYIYINRYERTVENRKVYDYLFELIKGRDYFILTTNVDQLLSAGRF